MKEEGLKWWYDKFNEVYFSNRLPDIPVRYRRMIPPYAGRTCMNKDHTPLRIEISRRLQEMSCYAIMALIHEMVHVEHPTWECLQVRFQLRMRELAAEGVFDHVW